MSQSCKKKEKKRYRTVIHNEIVIRFVSTKKIKHLFLLACCSTDTS